MYVFHDLGVGFPFPPVVSFARDSAFWVVLVFAQFHHRVCDVLCDSSVIGFPLFGFFPGDVAVHVSRVFLFGVLVFRSPVGRHDDVGAVEFHQVAFGFHHQGRPVAYLEEGFQSDARREFLHDDDGLLVVTLPPFHFGWLIVTGHVGEFDRPLQVDGLADARRPVEVQDVWFVSSSGVSHGTERSDDVPGVERIPVHHGLDVHLLLVVSDDVF